MMTQQRPNKHSSTKPASGASPTHVVNPVPQPLQMKGRLPIKIFSAMYPVRVQLTIPTLVFSNRDVVVIARTRTDLGINPHYKKSSKVQPYLYQGPHHPSGRSKLPQELYPHILYH